MTKAKYFTELFQWAVLVAIVVMAMPDLAVATESDSTDLNSMLHNVSKNELVALPYILSAVCYVAGAFMLVSGALKLKAHAESPNEKLAPGVARLLTGGAITSVPALTKIIQSTTQVGTSNQASFTTFSVTF
jgi:hypothetical protein